MDALFNELNVHSHIIVWTLITFGLLLVILGKFGWPAILKALEEREEGIRNDIDKAHEQLLKAEKMVAENEKLMAEADDKIRGMVEEAQRDAEVVINKARDEAKEEAEQIRARALNDIELAKDAAIGSLREESAHLAVSLAAKILAREITSDDHKALVQSGVEGVNNG